MLNVFCAELSTARGGAFAGAAPPGDRISAGGGGKFRTTPVPDIPLSVGVIGVVGPAGPGFAPAFGTPDGALPGNVGPPSVPGELPPVGFAAVGVDENAGGVNGGIFDEGSAPTGVALGRPEGGFVPDEPSGGGVSCVNAGGVRPLGAELLLPDANDGVPPSGRLRDDVVFALEKSTFGPANCCSLSALFRDNDT